MTSERAIAGHYTRGNLEETIREALAAQGKNPPGLTVADLAPVDHFHGMGLRATRALAELAAPARGMLVLDVGSGLGGPARYLAETCGCHVTGVDLTAEYCRVAGRLSEWTGLADRTAFRPGSALALPFADASFDLVWTQNVQMNVADKARFYAEIARVLRPRGRLACGEILQGPGGPPHFPVPWADTPLLSHLAPPEALRALMAQAGLREVHWEDVTADALAWRRKAAARGQQPLPPLGIHLLMGENFREKQRNQARNTEEGRILSVHALLEKAG